MTRAKRQRNILVVFDLNGTLMDRLTPNDLVERRGAWAEAQFTPPSADMSVNGRKVHLRPHSLDIARSVPLNASLAVWTSAKRKNVEPVVNHIFDDAPLLFRWYRDRCTIPSEIRWRECYKDLSALWQERPEWSPKNTILVDDSPRKAAYQPRNCLVVPTFEISHHSGQDTVLLSLQKYLAALAHSHMDVRRWMELHPFLDRSGQIVTKFRCDIIDSPVHQNE